MYHKNTNTDRLLIWLLHAPSAWKRRTLKVLINRAYTLYWTDYHQKEELGYLEKVFVARNNYPRWLVKQMMKRVLDEQTNRNVPNVYINLPNEDTHCSIKTPLISLPYKGKRWKRYPFPKKHFRLNSTARCWIKIYLHKNQVINKVSNER